MGDKVVEIFGANLTSELLQARRNLVFLRRQNDLIILPEAFDKRVDGLPYSLAIAVVERIPRGHANDNVVARLQSLVALKDLRIRGETIRMEKRQLMQPIVTPMLGPEVF